MGFMTYQAMCGSGQAVSGLKNIVQAKKMRLAWLSVEAAGTFRCTMLVLLVATGIRVSIRAATLAFALCPSADPLNSETLIAEVGVLIY